MMISNKKNGLYKKYFIALRVNRVRLDPLGLLFIYDLCINTPGRVDGIRPYINYIMSRSHLIYHRR